MRVQALSIARTQVADLGPLAGFTALRTLDASHTSVVELAPLTSLTALELLDLDGTPITDIGPLANLTALTFLRTVLDIKLPTASRRSPFSPVSRAWHTAR